MWHRLERLSNSLQSAINQMDSDQWIVVSIVALVLGALFLRGFGSRNSY